MLLIIIAYLFAQNLLLWLNKVDQQMFLYINRVLTNSFLDSVFPIWRDSQTWYPLYLFLFFFMLMNFGKKAWLWMLFFGLVIALCDKVSSGLFKDFFDRIRPCRDPQFGSYVRLLLNRCPSSGSFTSSHAANHFGMTVFAIHTFKQYLGKHKQFLYLWPVSICYAQVYIGVHYPFDVIGGALLGYIIGYASANFYNRRFGPLTLPSVPAITQY